MKAEVGYDSETKRYYLRVSPDTQTEWSMLRHVATSFGMILTDYDETARLWPVATETEKA